MKEKTCKRCHAIKTTGEFHNNKRQKDGLNPWCKECNKKTSSDYYYAHQEERKKWREKNRDRILEVKREYRKNNKEKTKAYKIKYNKEKEQPNKIWKLKQALRGRIRQSFTRKGLCKHKSTYEILGCTILAAKAHLEKQFKTGMTWDNHGFYGWHIDHIIPLASANTEREIIKLCHYTNLQPLWAKDNYQKRNKVMACNYVVKK